MPRAVRWGRAVSATTIASILLASTVVAATGTAGAEGGSTSAAAHTARALSTTAVDQAERAGPPSRTHDSAAVLAPASAGQVVQDLTTTTPLSVAQQLAGPGVTVTNATFAGDQTAGGRFSGIGAAGVGSGVVLSSGAVADVVGPNDSESTSKEQGTAGDAGLDAFAVPSETLDASVLTAQFVPALATITLRYVFGSEEYAESVGTQFNDVLGVFVNGQNCATVGGAPVTVNTINRDTRASSYRDNPVSGGALDVELDGLTTVLTCRATVTPGQTNTLKVAIADNSDRSHDSVVFLEASSLSSTTGIRIVTDSQPDAAQDFTYTRCAGTSCSTFALDDDNDATLPNTLNAPGLAPGTYTITQAAVAGWDLTDLTCDTGETTDLTQRRATITLTAGEHTTCTFTNASPTITIVTDSQPDAAQDFAYTGCKGTGCGPFSLDDDNDATLSNTLNAPGLAPGTYTITQAAVAGWDLTDLTCDTGETTDLTQRRATITLTAGEHTTCTFTNASPTITIVTDSQPDAAQDFAYTGCKGTGCGPFSLDDDNDATLSNTLNAPGLAPGTYTITQAAVAGWDLTDLTCDTGETTDLTQRRATITLTAGEHTTCTFTNATPPPANDVFSSPQIIAGASGSVTGSNVNATKQPGEPDHGGDAGGTSVWYKWTAPTTGTELFDTCSSDFDTVLGAYTGTAVSSLTTLAGGGDDCGTQSRMSFPVTAGTIYRIAVDGFSADTGNIALHWSLAPDSDSDLVPDSQDHCPTTAGTVDGLGCPALSGTFDVRTGDVNGDGRDDLIWNSLTASANRTRIGLANADGTFRYLPYQDHPAGGGWAAFRTLVGDVNGDGRDDLMWNYPANGSNRTYVALANADGTLQFLTLQDHPVAGAWQDFTPLVGDVNGDGRDDLIWSALTNTGNRTYVGLANANGTFTFLAFQDHPAGGGWGAFHTLVGDVNGDGRDDLIWGTTTNTLNRTYVGLANANGTFTLLPFQDHPAPGGWAAFHTLVADVNGDHRDDIVWSGTTSFANRTYVGLANADGTLQLLPYQDHPSAEAWQDYTTLVGDVNGDGRDDLMWNALTAGRNRTYVGLANASGTLQFLPYEDHPATETWTGYRTLAADINGDGRQDLLWNEAAARSRTYIALANPDGTHQFL